MLLYLFGYLVTGYLLIFMASLIHVCIALKLGYDSMLIRSKMEDIVKKNLTVFNFIIGSIIWPKRLIQFIRSQKELFNIYNQG